jgi:hypothetical protein
MKAKFHYDQEAVCQQCGGQDVHYNCYVEHGDKWFESDPDIAVWCRDCEAETSMVSAEEFESSQ